MLTKSFIIGLHAKFNILPQVSKNICPGQKEKRMSGSTPTVFTLIATKAKSGIFHLFSKKRSCQSHS